MSSAAGETIRVASKTPSRIVIISVLGVTQIFAWGSSYYLPAVLAKPIASDTGWSLSWVVGGLSLGLLIAGLVSPRVGRAIARRGGRPVLAVSAGLLAAGLSALALVHSLAAFLTAWLLIGLGMGAGLYDPAFATLGRLYGQGGRSAITTLTLFGGFASTVCWPLSAFLDAHLGWRGACLVYAGFQLAVALPAYLFVLPREPQRPAPLSVSPNLPAHSPTARDFQGGAVFFLMAATITLSSVISTTLSVHLLTVLQAKGLTLAAAVGLGALVGPSQVAARTVEMVIARYHHPIGRRSPPPCSWRRDWRRCGSERRSSHLPWRSMAQASGSKASPEARCPSRSSAPSVILSSWGASPCPVLLLKRRRRRSARL